MSGDPVLHLRPHHGICLLNFMGYGYSDRFSENMARTQHFLFSHPMTIIQITEGADDLCRRCPNRCENECRSVKPALFDQNVLSQTGFSYGQRLTWEMLSSRTISLSHGSLDRTCPDCEWLPLCRKIACQRGCQKDWG